MSESLKDKIKVASNVQTGDAKGPGATNGTSDGPQLAAEPTTLHVFDEIPEDQLPNGFKELGKRPISGPSEAKEEIDTDHNPVNPIPRRRDKASYVNNRASSSGGVPTSGPRKESVERVEAHREH